MSISLCYGRETRRFTWRRVRQYVFGAAVLGIAIAAFVYRDPLTAPFRRVYWQARLDQTGSNQPPVLRETTVELSAYQPGVYSRTGRATSPPAWTAYARAANVTRWGPYYIGKHRANGSERIVVVSRIHSFTSSGLISPPQTTRIALVVKVFDLASLFSAPKSRWKGQPVIANFPESNRIALFAGVPVLNTQDQFVIRNLSGEAEGTIVGTLHPDDTVTFEVESGPATLTPNAPITPIKF